VEPSTALARVLVDELVRGGVREAVLAPGSRSAPLALALHAADAAGLLRLHVRIDERSAAFLALGLAKASGAAVPVVTTSGTATANLHPAVLEAAHAGVPLLLLTADRPAELRGAGANQTIDQVGLYGGAVRWATDMPAPERRAGSNAYWRSLACRALAAAQGVEPGPVHLNLGFREPLVPAPATPAGLQGDWPEPLAGRAGAAPWTALLAAPAVTAPVDDLPARAVVVLGDAPPARVAAALALAAARGWPVVCEPGATLVGPLGGPPEAGRPGLLPGGDLLLGVPGWVEAHRPDRVLVVGRPTLSRAVAGLVASAPADVVRGLGAWADPSRQAVRVLPEVPVADPAAGRDAGWLGGWLQAAAQARDAAAMIVDAQPGLPEPVVAALVLAACGPGDLLVVGSSKPVRDLFLVGPRPRVRLLANRGVAGIDGMVSTALGAALAHQATGGGRALALIGDLTFLHDSGGLVLGPSEPRPDLTLVVVDNDGGAIFGTLEQGGAEHAAAFERVFGTPHGVDLAALCAATRTPYLLVTSQEELRVALAALPGAGVRVVAVRSDRAAAVELDRELRAAAAVALAAT